MMTSYQCLLTLDAAPTLPQAPQAYPSLSEHTRDIYQPGAAAFIELEPLSSGHIGQAILPIVKCSSIQKLYWVTFIFNIYIYIGLCGIWLFAA